MELITVELDIDFSLSTDSLVIDGIWRKPDVGNPVIYQEKLKKSWDEYFVQAIDANGEFIDQEIACMEYENGELYEVDFTFLTLFFDLHKDQNQVALKVIEPFDSNATYYVIDIQKTSEKIEEGFKLCPIWIKNTFQMKSKK